MRKFFTGLMVAAVLGFAAAGAAYATDLESLTDEERAAFRAEVRAYLLENPEVIFEAIQILEARRNEAAAAADRETVAANADALFNDGYSFVAGNPNGDITIVEFLDYRCGYCKRAHPIVEELLERDPNLKLVVKDFPILGPNSVVAGKMALAALDVDRSLFKNLNDALMTHQGDLTEDVAYRLAGQIGYDISALKDRAGSVEIDDRLNRNYQLAQALGLEGTPAFVVGQEVVRGFLPVEDMERIIANARERLN